uniref:Uncharacterized protein n=1 Tax=Lepeophtheirus salmonis TaxID=72036 RepID=A0A0K2VLK8_LEPSM
MSNPTMYHISSYTVSGLLLVYHVSYFLLV